MNAEPIDLIGIDGGNPLAFLAALGTLRSLTLAWPEHRVQMAWRADGPWRPALRVDRPDAREVIVPDLDARLRSMRDHPAWPEHDNLNIEPECFRRYTTDAAQAARELGDRTQADFAAAFGCESTVTRQGKIQDTAFRTMQGNGHQHFVRFIRNIVGATGPDHLEKALFRPWCYDDPAQNQSLNWDPRDHALYAHRWRDPSDARNRRSGCVLGAYRLAIEGLPLLPTIPTGRQLLTTGFRPIQKRVAPFTWPIWEGWLTLDVVRSLLAVSELQSDPPDRTILARIGVIEIFRSRRMTVDSYDGRRFSPGQPA